MENNNELLYCSPEEQVLQPEVAAKPQKVSQRKAVTSMIMGCVALFFSDLPVYSLVLSPIFAIISLVMRGKFKKNNPGVGQGFLKASKITSIVSLIMCVLVTAIFILAIWLMSRGDFMGLFADEYYYY